MKNKDIEKLIKNSSEKMVVPNVLEKIRAVPQKRLMLTIETPEQKYRRMTVIRSLLIFLAIVLVVSVVFFAYAARPSLDDTKISDSYVSISVTNGIGESTRYGIIVDNSMNIVGVINETLNAYKSVSKNSLTDMIQSFYVCGGGDSIYVCAHNTNLEMATYLANNIEEAIRGSYQKDSIDNFTFTRSEYDPSDYEIAANYLKNNSSDFKKVLQENENISDDVLFQTIVYYYKKLITAKAVV